MRQAAAGITIALAGLVAGPLPAAAQLRGEVLVQGLRNPVGVVADPTNPAVFFVVEQGGLIRVVRDRVPLEPPFLDLRTVISTGGERGLLGFALAPDVAVSRRVYVNFTNREGHTVVARFLRRADDPNRADPASRFDLVWPGGRSIVEQPFANHNGGHLLFGPDGYLYIGLGDGGSGGDPQNHAQNPQSLLGKMLRIDVAVPNDHPRGYRVPDDNPFVDGQPIAALGEIWAFGLRNPWRYSFDDATRGGVSALVIADVGQNAREEINFEPRGAGGRNYGWRLREGRRDYDPRTSPAYRPLTEPIHDYGRDVGQSITGGIIYRGAQLGPSFNGRYFYADFVAGRVFSIGLVLDERGEATAVDEREHTDALGGPAVLGLISTFGVDHNGELLVANYTAGTLVTIASDTNVVPPPPKVKLRGLADRDALRVTWSASPQGPIATSFVIEVLNPAGRVTQQLTVERPYATLDLQPGECIRVRGMSRGGVGGASAPVCRP